MRLRFSAFFFALFLLLFSVTTAAQQRGGNRTLLWRITGKGREQPSYLFGTMHLTDKRLFKLDDSVYHAIESTQGTAIEVSPDEMVAWFVNNTFDKMMHPKRLDELLDKEDYDKYAPALARRLHKPAADITAKDLVREKHKWVDKYLAKGEMPTFLDAYLYNLARRQGKWVGGIEDLTDQTSLGIGDVDKTDIQVMAGEDSSEAPAKIRTPVITGIEQLIRLYTSQDIEQLQALSEASGSAKDVALDKRNRKMARRMDSLSALRPMFFAVGAAHLAGDSGVISHLRALGFTVTPVFGSRQLQTDDYKYTPVPVAWWPVTDGQGLYTAMMPGNPQAVKTGGVIDTKFLFDLFSMTGYSTMAMVADHAMGNTDDLYARMAERMFKGKKNVPYKEIEKNGVKGREYLNVDDAMGMRVQLFNTSSVLYMAMAYTIHQKSISGADVNRFFDSFALHPEVVAQHAGELYTFTTPSGYAQVTTPAQLSYSSPLSGNVNGWAVKAYTGNDAASHTYTILMEKVMQSGYHLTADTSVLDDMCRQMYAKYEGECMPTTLQGYNGRIITGKSDSLQVRMKLVVRGNQTFVLWMVGEQLDGTATEQAFNSLKLLPYKEPVLTKQEAEDGRFAMLAPSGVSYFRTEEGIDSSALVAYDSSSNTSYYVQRDTLSAYTWAASSDAFWKQQEERYLGGATDSILSVKVVQRGGDTGREWLSAKGNSGICERLQLVQHGNILYALSAYSDPAVVTSPAADKVFSSFAVHGAVQPFALTTNKTKELLRDLSSSDSLQRVAAFEAIGKAPFTNDDVPQLRQALFVRYPEIQSDYMTPINAALADQVVGMDDAGTLPFVQERYALLKGDDTELRPIGLRVLAQMRTRESYAAMGQLLAEAPPATPRLQYLQGALLDSLPLLAASYASFAPLLKDERTGYMAARLTNMLADSGYLKPADLAAVEPQMMTLAAQRLKVFEQDSMTTTDDYTVVHALRAYKTAAAQVALTAYLKEADHYLASRATIALAAQGVTPDAKLLLPIAADSVTCVEFYNGLAALHKESLFPAVYKTQRHFAAGALYAVLSDGNNEPEQMTYVGTRTRKSNDTSYVYYLYKLTYTNDDSSKVSYLGISGGYLPKGGALLPEVNNAGVFTQREYNRADIDVQLGTYLQAGD